MAPSPTNPLRLVPVRLTSPGSASEDFTVSREWNVRSVYWFVGGIDPKKFAEAKRTGSLNELPAKHSPISRLS